MIVFYPRDIGMWRDEYDFTQDITLAPKEKTNHRSFHSKQEFIDYLKSRGVSLDDPKYPLEFIDENNQVHGACEAVVQWSLLGFIKDDYK